MTFDTIVKGGTVVDGSGLPMRREPSTTVQIGRAHV